MSRAQWRIGDRYELFYELGSGACGSVWYGRDLRTGAERAVKVLEPGLAAEGEALSAFYARLSAVARLAHANIVAVDEVVALDGRIALAMRLVPGDDLRALLVRRGLPRPAQAALMAAQLADGLAAAHTIGAAHGDIKPANVLCESGGNGVYTARLTDFGMTLLTPAPTAQTPAAAVPPAEYLAPELEPGEPGTPAADVYALGILLYETLAGRPPFTGPRPEAIAELHRDVRPPWIRGLPELLWPPVAACLEKRPEGRPGAEELAGLLRDIAGLIEAEPAADDMSAELGPVFAADGVGRLSDAARRAADTMAISLAAPLEAGAAQPRADARPRSGHAARKRRAAHIAELAAAVAGVVAGIVLAVTGSGGNPGPTVGAGQTATVPLVILSPGPVGATASAAAPVSASADASPSASASPDASASAPAASAAPTSPSATPSHAPSLPASSSPAGPPPPPRSSPPAAEGPALVSFQSGKCLDTSNAQFANGTPEVLLTCDGSAGQGWTYTPSGQLTQDGGAYCLDDNAYQTAPGTKVQIWQCNGGENQRWILHQDGTITSSYAGLCLDVTAHGTADGTPIQLYNCDGHANQQWYFR